MDRKCQNTVVVTPTVDTNAYGSGDLVGTKLTFTDLLGSFLSGKVLTLVVRDLAKQSAALDLILFSADPTGTTFTDNSAFDVADADLAKVLGHVPVAAADYAAFADNSVATVRNVQLALNNGAVGSGTLYGALVSRGTPTYADSGLSLSLALTVERD